QRYSPERITQDMMRGVLRMSGAAVEMPMQMQEILDDLREGAFRVQVQEAELKEAADHLGRRVFSSIIIASLYLAAAILVASGFYWVAAATALLATTYAGGHHLFLFVLGRQRRLRR